MKQQLRRKSWVAALVLGACASSHGFANGFDEGWLWDQGQTASVVLGRLQGKTAPQRVDAAVGVTGHGLVGRRLPGGALWTYEGEVNVLPSLVGDVVGFSGDDKVTLLDVATGKPRFSIPAGGRRLEGLGYDGKFAILLLVDEDDARPDQVAVVSELGQVRFSTTTVEHVGTPAAFAGLGFVPWSNQYVSVFDLTTGDTLGRILVRDSTNRAEVQDNQLLFLGQGALALSPQLAQNPGLPSLRLPRLELPGEPSWPLDGSKPRPARAQSVGLQARPTGPGANLSFATGGFTTTYYEIALGLEATSGQVRWASHFERSIVGSEASPTTLGVCLEDGTLWQVGLRDGSVSPSGSLENRLRACVLYNAAPPGAVAKALGIEDQILDTVTNTGPDMAAMHSLLVDALSQRPGAAATSALLSIAQNPLTSTPVVDRAGRALGGRSEGADAMIRALIEAAPELPPPPPPASAEKPTGSPKPGKPPAEKPQAAVGEPPKVPPDQPGEPHPALEPSAQRRQTKRSPPIVALARALTGMGDKRAATPLARQLLAPSLTAEQATALLDALSVLGGAEQSAFLLEFFGTYRAAGGEPEFIAALGRAGQLVAKNGTPAEKAVIDKAAVDPLTHPDLRKSLSALLAQTSAK